MNGHGFGFEHPAIILIGFEHKKSVNFDLSAYKALGKPTRKDKSKVHTINV
jgi:hypothetical protein